MHCSSTICAVLPSGFARVVLRAMPRPDAPMTSMPPPERSTLACRMRVSPGFSPSSGLMTLVATCGPVTPDLVSSESEANSSPSGVVFSTIRPVPVISSSAAPSSPPIVTTSIMSSSGLARKAALYRHRLPMSEPSTATINFFRTLTDFCRWSDGRTDRTTSPTVLLLLPLGARDMVTGEALNQWRTQLATP